ncbi:hypothetical protein ILUMI_16471 [Ignelater luminosus]|uniref:Uncharacterized protein n=1 Tax=Ignelater luminosus TaxID=2038154 RepID=A0A8K0CSX5_IGNLU|nr:hypothetical protein ILUMI_16471 [Ignelater luminosus]
MDVSAQPLKAKIENQRMDKNNYQSEIESLLHIVQGIRPDIVCIANVLCQFCIEPTVTHQRMIQHLFRYLKGSSLKRLVYNFTSTRNGTVQRCIASKVFR